MKATAYEHAQTRHWEMVLSDPQAPAELRAKAAEHLAIQIPVSGNYAPELDSLVRSYWGAKKGEEEQRHPVAERLYHALVGLLILGGSTSVPLLEGDVETVLAAYAICKSDWTRTKCARALLTALVLNRDSLQAELRSKVESALNSTTDLDIHQPDGQDLIGLLRDAAKQHETVTTQSL